MKKGKTDFLEKHIDRLKNHPPPARPGGQNGYPGDDLTNTIIEFADKFLLPPPNDDEDFHEALNIAIAIWNMPLMKEADARDAMDEMRDEFELYGDPAIDADIEELLKIRREKHGHDRRAVVSYTLNLTDEEGPHLSLVTLDTAKLPPAKNTAATGGHAP